MSNLIYIEKLLDLPAGRPIADEVAWLPLGDVTTLKRGRVMSKGYFVENAGDFPVYSSQTARNGMIGKIDTFDFDGEYISWTTDGANAGTVFHRTGKFSITNVCGSIKINDEAKLNCKFLFYWLSIEAKKHVYSGMGNPKLMSHQVEKIPVPIPCPDDPRKSLEIQAEIVRILDAFTSLTAELTAELTARKKQYNYYRDRLLTFSDDDAQWLPLEKLTQYEQPAKYRIETKNYDDKYKMPVLTAGKTFILGHTDETDGIYQASDAPVIIFDDFTTANKWVDFDFKVKSSAMKMITSSDDTKFILKYVYYWMNTLPSNLIDGDHKRQWISNYCNKKIPIPCPDDPEKSLAEQARIVDTLDKFDALTNSISEGLPREIELRQKQYEYYRDLLLNFPKPEDNYRIND